MAEKSITDIEKSWDDFQKSCEAWATLAQPNTLERLPSIDSILKTIELGRTGDLDQEWISMMRLLQIIRGHQITQPEKRKIICDMMEDLLYIYDETDDREWINYALEKTEATTARLKTLLLGL